MFHSLRKRVWILAGAMGAAVFAVLVTLNTGKADEALVVGTYDIDQVAMQSGLQQKVQMEMAGLQQRMQEAQQEGDQAAMQQIQAEAGQIQERIIGEFEDSLDGVMPSVAASSGAKVIAADVTYTAPGIEVKDVTSAVIEEMNGGEAAAPSIAIPGLPQQAQ
jgi:hypothetical protein